MSDYLFDLQSSTLPFPLWGIVILWLFVFVTGHVLFRRARSLNQAQQFVKVGNPKVVANSSTPKFIVLQLCFAAAIFAFSDYSGGATLVFFAGGWVIATSASIAVNISSLLFVRAIAKPGAADGSLTLTNPLVVRENAFYFFGLACFCLIVGILTAHLALFGGAVFIAATGLGFFRKAPNA